MNEEEALQVESISLHDLSTTEESNIFQVRQSILRAFGPEGPGILLIHDVPSEFHINRERLLDAGFKLPSLSEEQLSQLEFSNIKYSTGWSHGREMFKGIPDTCKGSFYANPLYDDPSLGDSQLIQKYPYNMHPNCWPRSDDVKELEPSFKFLGNFINETALLIAKQIDEIVKSKTKNNDEPITSIYETLLTSRSCKGRLLHYFPKPTGVKSDNLWCGFHNDHGTLTGLLSAKFYPCSPPRDDDAGLYVMHKDKARRVIIPSTCLAFQVGETAQIFTGGILTATPHAVRASSNNNNKSRVTLAVFLQPNPWTEMKSLKNTDNDPLYSHNVVPSLTERFQHGNTFQQFAQATLSKFYF